jgi:hypothetical protein
MNRGLQFYEAVEHSFKRAYSIDVKGEFPSTIFSQVRADAPREMLIVCGRVFNTEILSFLDVIDCPICIASSTLVVYLLLRKDDTSSREVALLISPCTLRPLRGLDERPWIRKSCYKALSSNPGSCLRNSWRITNPR